MVETVESVTLAFRLNQYAFLTRVSGSLRATEKVN